MTWATDADINAEDSLAYTALSAYSEAAVARSESAITTYEGLRTIAQRQIRLDLSARNISSDEITNTDVMVQVEVYCVLAKLFGAVAQYTHNQADVYAARALKYEAKYTNAVRTVNPVAYVRGVGASFEWGRG